jgi:hypothetical protein
MDMRTVKIVGVNLLSIWIFRPNISFHTFHYYRLSDHVCWEVISDSALCTISIYLDKKIKSQECNKQFFLFIMLYNTWVAIRIDIKLYAVRPKDIFELITVLIAHVSNLWAWIDIVNVIFFLHSTCSFPPKKPKYCLLIIFLNILFCCVIYWNCCSLFWCILQQQCKIYCDGSGNSRDDERG